MNLEKKFQICLVILLITAQFSAIQIMPSAEANSLVTSSKYPVVYVYPDYIERDIGETFTIAVVGFNFTDNYIKDPENPVNTVWLGNLYGFDIEFTWDPTVLKYVSHTVTCPVENYPAPNPPSPYGGALYKDIISVKNIVNEAGNIPDATSPRTRAWFSFASMGAPGGQNGNVTFFTMTFQAIKYGASKLEILSCDLAAFPQPGKTIRIYRILQDGKYSNPNTPIADFTYWPEAPVANKTVMFNATIIKNMTNIVDYIWDFGDGNITRTPSSLINHTYITKGEFNVGLKVKDAAGFESAWENKTLHVIPWRDLEVYSITIPERIEVGIPQFSATVALRNWGETSETGMAYIYYNTTALDPADPLTASWNLIDQKSFNVTAATAINPGTKLLSFNVSVATLPKINASYYMLVNITTGIPSGYERNLADNYKVSDYGVYLTDTPHYELSILKIECLWKAGAKEGTPPLIEGEPATVKVTVRNKSTREVNATFETFINGVSWENSTQSLLHDQQKIFSVMDKAIKVSGVHNITVVAKAGDFTTSVSTTVRVVKPPILNFTFKPTSPKVNETVTFNASATVYQDPEGTISDYTWAIFAPGVDWIEGSPIKTLNGTVATFIFNKIGNWTVVLKIKDAPYKLEFDKIRPSTNVYALSVRVQVTSEKPIDEEEGIPIEYILAAVLAIIAVIVAVVYLVIRKRKVALAKSQSEET